MLTEQELKIWLHKDLSRADKVLLVLATSVEPLSLADIQSIARNAGCKMHDWNISNIITRAKGTAIRLPTGYEVAERGRLRLRELGVSKLSSASAKVATDLRQHLAGVKNKDTRAFLEEAISCFEFELYRSAIVMSWLAAVGVLQNEVVANHLGPFNAAAKIADPKWKQAQNADDLGRLKEVDFLDRLVGISMIGKNVKEELVKSLKLRNGCGHPNSLKVGANVTASHIELLSLNVLERFAS